MVYSMGTSDRMDPEPLNPAEIIQNKDEDNGPSGMENCGSESGDTATFL